jgi:nucleoside-diphosphate-sugar epimerase
MRLPLRRHLRGKTVLLTGSTGFLGKVVVERLLRCAPEIGRVYLLIRPRSEDLLSAATRFETEVLTSGAFRALACTHGHQWQAFARSKLVPIDGDVSQPRLGLADAAHAALASCVDIIINVAASVTFDAPIDEALGHNTRSVAHVAEFARTCRSAILVHVSTAYVAGKRKGTIAEGPLLPEVASAEVRAIEQLVDEVRREAETGQWDARTTRARLVEEGMSRARGLGWHDTYTYTKALGEMVLERERDGVPTTIVRPTIIESSLRHPEPGWLENLNVGDPLWVEYGRGRMPDFPLASGAICDFVPVDHVANALLATLPRVAETQDIAYYTVGSGALNPLTGAQFSEITYDYFARHPMYDRNGEPIPPRRLTFPTYERFREMYSGDRSMSMKRLMYLAELYESYMNINCVFDTSNTQQLLDELHEADRAALDFDVRGIDWRSYLQDIHFPGLRRHVLREGGRPREIRRRA